MAELENRPLLKRFLFLPLLFAVLLVLDYYRPERIEHVTDFHIYGYTGRSRYSNSGKYLVTPHQEFTISDSVYYDLDHTQPIQIHRTPFFEALKAITFQSREFSNTTFEYRPTFSLYGLNFLWILVFVGITLYGLLAKNEPLAEYALVGSYALCLLFLLIIFL